MLFLSKRIAPPERRRQPGRAAPHEPTSKLREKPQISCLQLPDVVIAVPHHGKPRQPQPECEAIPFIRIDATRAQHIWMHEAARQQFHPPALLAHRAAWAAADQALNVEFKSGLDERKI